MWSIFPNSSPMGEAAKLKTGRSRSIVPSFLVSILFHSLYVLLDPVGGSLAPSFLLHSSYIHGPVAAGQQDVGKKLLISRLDGQRMVGGD